MGANHPPDVRPGAVILVVEDDRDSADLLVEMLSVKGFEPIHASSVAEALLVLEVRPVRYVVTDYAMPVEDGLGLIERLARRPEWSAIPVLMVSGHDATGAIARRARALGARFMPKPYDLEVVVGLVARELGLVDEGPRTPPAPAPSRPAISLGGPVSLGGAIVLVIDPDPTTRQRLSVALARAGASARAVESVEDAVPVVSLEPVDAIVSGGEVAGVAAGWLAGLRRDDPGGFPALVVSDDPRDGDGFDARVALSAPAREVVERIAGLLAVAPTRRLPRAD